MAVSPQPVSISLSHALPPSSPGAGPSSSHHQQQSQPPPHHKTFRRLRTSLEHTIRNAAAAAGSRSRREPHPPPSASSASPNPNPASRFLKHKHSASDTQLHSALSPHPSSSPQHHSSSSSTPTAMAMATALVPPSAPPAKGKHRTSVDFVGVERSRDRERERERQRVSEEREREKMAANERATSVHHTSRFSVGVSGGLRKLESKVGLRRLSSREAARPDATAATPPQGPPSSSPTQALPISGPTKLRRERDKQAKDRDRDRDIREVDPSTRTRTRTKWSFLAPSLTSHPSVSASALDVSTSTASTSTTYTRDRDWNRERDREKEKETVRASSPPLPPAPPPHTRSRSPPSPTPPPRISPTESHSRSKLTSPSSPSLSSPTSSTSPTSSSATPVPASAPGIAPTPSSSQTPVPRLRTRPGPIQATSRSGGASSSASSSPHTLSRSATNPLPPSPTTPTSLASASQSQTPRNVSPTPSRPSRPPLSPSAGVNAASRMRLRHAMAAPAAGSGIRSVSTTSLPMEPSSLSSSSSVAERDKPPERPERRRPSMGSVTTVTTGNGTGRTTPTGMPSHAAPTSSSRSRAESTRAHELEREKDRQQQQQAQVYPQAQTRSRASASASSLVLSRAEADRSRSPSQSGAGAGIPRRATSPAASLPPGQRDVIRHATSLLLRELNGPRPRAIPRSSSTPAPASQPISSLQSLFPSSTSAPTVAQDTWTPEVWDECEARLRLMARAERVRLGGPYGGSAVSLVGAGAGSVNTAGEERERRVFAEAVRDGYVLCQLVNKLKPGTIARVDPYEDGFKSSSNATKFLAAATGPFGLPASELFERDDLIKSAPDALFRVARAIVAVVARAGEDAAAERVARKILLGGGGGGGGQSKEEKQPANSPYGTRAKGASSSTPNLSTLQRSASPPAFGGNSGLKRKQKRWSPPSPALSTVAGEDTGSGTVSPDRADSSKAGSTSGKQSRAKSKERQCQKSGGGSRSGSGESANTETQAVRSRLPFQGKREDESALATDSESESEEEDDENEQFYDADSKYRSSASIAPAVPPKPAATPPLPVPGRVSLGSETTQSTAPSSLLTASRPRRSTGGADRASTQFGTIRTATTVATSVVPSENYGADVSTRVSASEASMSASGWDEISSGSAQSSGFVTSSLMKKPQLRDRRPSEAAMNDLSRVSEEAEDGVPAGGTGAGGSAAPEPRRRPQAIQLGKGKWPEDFVQAFKTGPGHSPPRSAPGIAFHRAEAERVLSSSPLASSPPHLPAHVLGHAEGSDSAESLPQLAPRRPLHRPRHSIDAPVLRPRELPREGSTGPEGPSAPRIVPKRTSSTNRHGMYIPRSDSGSPNPSPDTSSARVPFPRAVSGEHLISPSPVSGASGPEMSATTAAASAAQQSRFSRGRFQSDVDVGSRRRPRPNSYDELGAKPHRSRIESMISIGGASSSNFSASDIRSSMDGSAMRKTLIIKDEGRPTVHFQLGNCIGRGQFGSVYKALNLNTGQMVAVKRIRLEGLSEEDVRQLMREVDMVKSLSHPSIVKYEGMSKDSDTLNIVLEYAENGSLGQTLKAFGKLNEKLVATYVIKILEGLDYLHRNDVVHCDLKAANILTTKNGNVKLSDFGVSLNLRKVGRDQQMDVTGTPNWMAPEVIELKGASRASDIWSLGCTVIELLTGRPPYADIPNGMSVMYRIVDDPMPPIPEEWSPLLKDFLQQCFQREPANRPGAEALSEHEWLKEHCDVHKVVRPKDSIPFLRRVSQDLQQRPDVVRFLVEGPRSDSRASVDPPRRSEERSASPATSGLPGSSPKNRLLTDPMTPKSPQSDVTPAREHSFVKTAFGKPLQCGVCEKSVKKHAVVCEECSLISHARCAALAPSTCVLRAQLLRLANNPPSPDSPETLQFIKQLTPSSSPLPDSVLSSQPFLTPTQEEGPPTAFRMFGAFRRSRSSLGPDQDKSRKRTTSTSQASGEESNDSIRAAPASGQASAHPTRPAVLLKPLHARPISMSSDNMTPNRGSHRSADTAASIDLSDDSYSPAHTHSQPHSQSTTYTYSRSQSALDRSRSRGRDNASGHATPLGPAINGETDAEAEAEAETAPRYAPNRFSMAVSAADSNDPRRASVLAAPSVGDSYDDYEDDELEGHAAERERVWRRRPRPRHESRPSVGGEKEKEKGCVLQ